VALSQTTKEMTFMTGQIKMIAASLLLVGMIGLTGCGTSNNQAANSANSTTAPTEVTPTATPEPEASPTATPEQSAPVATTAPNVNHSDTDNVASSKSDKQLKELFELAKEGQVPGVKYAAHTGLIDVVEKDWGKPNQEETAGKGIYATYTDKHAVFGFNKGSQIFDVRSSEPSLQKLTLKEIETTLGKPHDTKANGEDQIYTYQVNKQFKLRFVIPHSTGTVHHISVFSEQDSINNMAG